MIIMINGAFGVGKTTTANLLRTRLPNSIIYDPEEVGYMLQKIIIPNNLQVFDDFQHIKPWTILVGEVARQLHQHYHCHLIVPMTLSFPQYFQQIKASFLQFSPDLYHFCLMASTATISHRLEERGDLPGSWAHQQITRCLNAFADPQYETYIDTETHDSQAVADFILAQII